MRSIGIWFVREYLFVFYAEHNNKIERGLGTWRLIRDWSWLSTLRFTYVTVRERTLSLTLYTQISITTVRRISNSHMLPWPFQYCHGGLDGFWRGPAVVLIIIEQTSVWEEVNSTKLSQFFCQPKHRATCQGIVDTLWIHWFIETTVSVGTKLTKCTHLWFIGWLPSSVY